MLLIHLLPTKCGKLAIFAGIFVGGGGIGNVAIENFVDGLGQQFSKLFAITTIIRHLYLIDCNVGLKFVVCGLANEKERRSYTGIFVLKQVGIVECLEYVRISVSIAFEKLADCVYLLL